jgi:hypothetical protein
MTFPVILRPTLIRGSAAAGENLILSPEDLTDTNHWTASGLTVTADSIQDASVVGVGTITQNIVVQPSTWYRFTGRFLKDALSTDKRIRFNTDQDVYIDTQAGTISSQPYYGLTVSIADRGLYWGVTIDILTGIGQTSLPFQMAPAGENSSFTGSTTVDALRMVRLYEQPTVTGNLFASEQDFTQADWTKSNASAWVNGLFDASAVSQGHVYQSLSLAPDFVYELSVRVKKDAIASTSRLIALSFNSLGGGDDVATYFATDDGAMFWASVFGLGSFMARAFDDYEAVDEGDYWRFKVQAPGKSGTTNVGFGPGRAVEAAGVASVDGTYTGSATIDLPAVVVASAIPTDPANLLAAGNDFTDAAWSNPAAAFWSNLLVDNAFAANVSTQQTATVAPSTAHVFTCRVKKTNNSVPLGIIFDGSVVIQLTTLTGVISSSSGGYVASTSDESTHWRVEVTFTTGGAQTTSTVAFRPAYGDSSYAGTVAVDQVVLKPV